MQIKTLLGERVIVIPDNSDEKTASGIIIPEAAKSLKENLKSGIIAKKGTGTKTNPMNDVHLKNRVWYKRESGAPYEEENDGQTVQYLILSYSEIILA